MKKIVIGCFIVSVTLALYIDKCPTTEDHPTFYPHETNCSQYYQCSHGSLVLRECPANLYFNINLDVCDNQNNVDCSVLTTDVPTTSTTKIPTSVPITTTEATSPQTSTNPATTTSTPKTTTWPDDVFCEDSSSAYEKPYPNDCTRYISCDYGKITVYSCPNNQHFDIVDQICKIASEAVCKNIYRRI